MNAQSLVQRRAGRPRFHRTMRALPGTWLAALLLVCALLSMAVVETAAQTVAADGPVYIVPITGTIDLGLAPYLERVIDEAEEAGAAAVILDIDTPGGRLDAVLQMQDTLLDADVRTIAFVNRTAFSAGALIAIAAEEIYMVPGAVMGAATPVDQAGETATEKVVSAVSSTFRTTAEVRGRDPEVAAAMVDPDIVIEGLDGPDELLTLTTTEALDWGYAEGVVANRAELLQVTGLDGLPVEETSPSPAERIVRFLTDPVIASLLISAAMLLIIGDILVGGFGLIGVIGIAMLAAFFWGHTLAGLAGWEDIALVVIGLALIGVEIFVIPGFGIPGIAGLVALGAGLWLAMIGREIRTPEATERAGWTVTLALIIAIAGTIALLALVPKARRLGGLVLSADLGPGTAATAQRQRGWLAWFGGGTELDRTPEPGARPSLSPRPASLTGATGTALTDLRPSGVADIKNWHVDVVTSGEYVRRGTPLVVVADEGYRCIVRRKEI